MLVEHSHTHTPTHMISEDRRIALRLGAEFVPKTPKDVEEYVEETAKKLEDAKQYMDAGG